MEDSEILEEIQRGKTEYLDPLMKKYGALVYRVLLRFSNPGPDLDDLAQEVWMKVFFKVKDLKKKTSFRAWLINIAYHEGIDHLKKLTQIKKKRQEVSDFFFEKGEEVFENEIYKMVWEELKALKMKYQLPIIMYFFENFSYEEIADVSGIKLNTIKSLIKRGKEILGAKLKQRGVAAWNI